MVLCRLSAITKGCSISRAKPRAAELRHTGRHADPQQATSILQQLQFTCQTLAIGETTLLVINAEGEELEQAQEVIAKLDRAPEESEAAEEATETSEAAEETAQERVKDEAPDVDPVPPKAGNSEAAAEQDETE